MGERTTISWTDRTFNPWWGCARVSPACRFCYADNTAHRWGKDLWRRHGQRQMMAAAYWRRPPAWSREAQRAGRPLKVFCASMADVFERHPEPEANVRLNGARERLWSVIEDTPWLRWQLLTKRPENVTAMVPWQPGRWPANVWLGTSVETQRYAHQRIPHLLAAGAGTTFLSCEPLLDKLNLSDWLGPRAERALAARGWMTPADRDPAGDFARLRGNRYIDWVIAGGESGTQARRTELAWCRSLRDQCAQQGVPFFMKQLGTRLARDAGMRGKGEDIHLFPADLRVQQFPREAVPAC